MKHVAADPIGPQPAREVSRMDAFLFGERLKHRANGRGGVLAPKTRRHIQKAIRQAFDASWSIEANPFARVALPPSPMLKQASSATIELEETDS